MQCMKMSDDYLEYTKQWITRIDRGGLFRVNDETFLMFHWMEVETRKFLYRQGVDISKAVEAILSSEQVLSCWSLICNLQTEKSDKLLIDIAQKWITLRGYSYTGNLIEQYKVHFTSSKGKKGLRKTLKCTS